MAKAVFAGRLAKSVDVPIERQIDKLLARSDLGLGNTMPRPAIGGVLCQALTLRSGARLIFLTSAGPNATFVSWGFALRRGMYGRRDRGFIV
ncbi:hypothetical protein [Novosphingobium sp. Gsoil 351]|uniref:hypothetical protein n=1 Tax=Novosphingobium sp. Gsoil 351 TaxID=2675225 RepID=UPI0018A81578|nr:hypothetical protein [Novosphingobium sp. Gsoil 351]